MNAYNDYQPFLSSTWLHTDVIECTIMTPCFPIEEFQQPVAQHDKHPMFFSVTPPIQVNAANNIFDLHHWLELWTCVPAEGINLGTSNYIPHILWDTIICPCPLYLLLAHKSSIMRALFLDQKYQKFPSIFCRGKKVGYHDERGFRTWMHNP